MEADSSPSSRRFTPPESPTRIISPEIVVDFVNDTFLSDSTTGRRCGCIDPFCIHRFNGHLDDFQLSQFLDLTRNQSGEVVIIDLCMLLLVTFFLVFIDFVTSFINYA